MPHSSDPTTTSRRLAIAVRGVVQGVGFRPFVYQTAQGLGLTGWVRNEAGVVRIEAQGIQAALERFVEVLRHHGPPHARVDALDVSEIATACCSRDDQDGFAIQFSDATAAPRPTIPADLAVCGECLAEIRDPTQRRHRYPFTNCTNCGPRWSIIERLPYDRQRTSMCGFEMCPDCRAEFENPADRRFHAQPIACPRCGPLLQLLDCEGGVLASGEAAMAHVVQAVLAGHIVALKGLGGFQLVVDATRDEAVARLRMRKHRPDRPFALMMASLDLVREYCSVSNDEARMLLSPQSPIVLLRRRLSSGGLHLAPLAAPNNPYLGVMLPYTPLHHLLMEAIARPIICTSGNVSEEPMSISTEDALARLGDVADAFLTHDRPIVRPVDDSIVRCGSDGVQILRRARGFAPLPIEIRLEYDRLPPILAVGGHLKNTVALSLAPTTSDESSQVVLSAHVGDLDSVSSVEVFGRAVDDLLGFFHVAPSVVACDLHPDYASTRYAERFAAESSAALLPVQHHHAHVAACMAEHGLRGPVLGFAWDGTGYGTDGTVWGGEALLCEEDVFRRVGWLRTFPLPGGDRASREPRRSALGLLFAIFGPLSERHAAAWFNAIELEALLSMMQRRVNSPQTSSMGRLFDAVAVLCGLQPTTSFEGQAAMALEFAADESEQGSYAIRLSKEEPCVADWEPLVRAVLADRAAGVPIDRISARFHNALADMAVAMAQVAAPASGECVLSGGCFQNALLGSRVHARLSGAGFRVYTHHKVPPGDGGIALGQVFVALNRCRGVADVSRDSG